MNRGQKTSSPRGLPHNLQSCSYDDGEDNLGNYFSFQYENEDGCQGQPVEKNTASDADMVEIGTSSIAEVADR